MHKSKFLTFTLAASCRTSLSVLFVVSSMAQAQSSKAPGVFPSPLPGGVPDTAKPFLKERDALEKRLVPKGSKARSAGSAAAAQESEEQADADEKEKEKPPAKGAAATELGLPGLAVPQADNTSGEVIKNREDSTQANHKLLPRFESVPGSGIAGFLGQTLVLSVSPKKIEGSAQDTFVAWVLNGEVLCIGNECEIPLDGKKLNVGTASLLVLAYNNYGSTLTRHVLQVVRGNWDPSQPFTNKFKKKESIEKVDPKITAASKDLPRVYMVKGNAVQAYPDYLQLFGSVPRNVEWQGRFKTAGSSVLRLQDPKSGDWFLLSKTDTAVQRNPSNPGARILRMSRGGLRLRGAPAAANSADSANKTKKFLEDVRILTDEIDVTPAVGSDLSVLRIPPNAANLAKRKTRKPGEELPLKEQYSSRMVVIAGSARIDIPKAEQGKPKSVVLPPGVEFVVYENGTVLPLARPNPARMERLMKLTLSPEEIAERALAKKAQPKITDLPAHLKKVEDAIAAEDYFDALNLIVAVEDRAAEDVRIPYYSGVGQRGIYQLAEAEKSFKKAAAQDPHFALAPWQLAQMKLEEKKYTEAKQHFDEAQSRMKSDDKLAPEYHYYSGVVRFQQGSEFSSRSAFTRALWEQNLDAALKQSAGSFMKTLGAQKKWSFVAPLGMQYETNGLGLASSESVPEGFPKRSLARMIAGGIFTYDQALGQEKPGFYWGGGAKVISLKNFPSGFKQLDALVLEASVSQTSLRFDKNPDGKGEPVPGSLKFTEIYSPLFLGGKLFTHTFTLDVNTGKFNASVGFEADAQGKGDESKSAIVLKQAYSLDLGEVAPDAFSADFEADERIVTKKTTLNGNQLTLSATPNFSVPFSLRTSAKFSLLTGVQFTLLNPVNTQYKASPSASLNYFITPWLLGIGQVANEFSIYKPGTRTVSKPLVSVMLTGIF